VLSILPQLLVSGLLIGGVYALLSIGLTLIFGVLRIVNFAQGEFIMLAMFGAFWANVLLGIDPYLSALVVVPVIFVLGMLVERFVIQRIMYAPHSMQIFATFGLSVLLQNLALTFWGPDYHSVTTSYTSLSYTVAGLSISATSLFAFIAAIVMAAGLIGFLHFTRGGRALRAMVQNRYAASLMGVNTKRLNRLAFGCGVACAAVSGCILTPMYYTFPTVGIDLIITGFVVVVLGGMGSVAGAVVGGLIIGVAQTLTGFYLSVEYKDVVALLLFIVILLVRPQGLFGRVGAEEMGTK
jgi:branched-chain amino acid transport system permease protein